MKRKLSLLFLVLLIVFTTIPVAAQNKIVISVYGFDYSLAQVANIILPEAYKKLGYDVEFSLLPPARAYDYFHNEKVDAHIFADKNFSRDHPNSIRIKTPIGNDNCVVFSKKKDITINGWESLKPYSIGYQKEMIIIHDNIKGMNTDPGKDPATVFKKLDIGRTDIVIMPEGLGMLMIKKLKLEGIYVINPPLVEVELYHYVNPKWEHIADKLSDVLFEMQEKGRIKEVTDKVNKNFFKYSN